MVDRLVERVNATLPVPRSYAVVHADTGDARGIDVAFLYDDTLFEVPLPLAESVFYHVVIRRNVTREIDQVNFKPPRWPPGPRPSSAPLAQPESRSIRVRGLPRHCWGDAQLFPPADPRGARTQTAVHAMGDSTDEPFDTTLLGSTRAAPSTRQRAKVTNARENTLLWNLMWPDAGLPDGSFYFDKQPNMLNQFLVIKNMATGGAPIKVNAGTGPRSSNRRPWSIQVTTYSQFRTAEWAIRSIRTDSPTTSQITMTVAEVD